MPYCCAGRCWPERKSPPGGVTGDRAGRVGHRLCAVQSVGGASGARRRARCITTACSALDDEVPGRRGPQRRTGPTTQRRPQAEPGSRRRGPRWRSWRWGCWWKEPERGIPFYSTASPGLNREAGDLYRSNNCRQCHSLWTIKSAFESVPAPALDGIGSLRSEQWFYDYFSAPNPQNILPSRLKLEYRMPSLASLPDADRHTLARTWRASRCRTGISSRHAPPNMKSSRGKRILRACGKLTPSVSIAAQQPFSSGRRSITLPIEFSACRSRRSRAASAISAPPGSSICSSCRFSSVGSSP